MATTHLSPAAENASERLQRAYKRFKDSVNDKDRKMIVKQEVTESDVRVCIKDLEDSLENRRSVKNIARIKPFLEFLNQYKGIAETLTGVCIYRALNYGSRF